MSLVELKRASPESLAADGEDAVDVIALMGTYYLSHPLSLVPLASRSASLRILAEVPGTVTITGGRKLSCSWEPEGNGIFRCAVPKGLMFDQLFVNGKRQVRARYPTFDPTEPKKYSGYVRAAGKIPDDDLCPAPDENDDMIFSSGSPKGFSLILRRSPRNAGANPIVP